MLKHILVAFILVSALAFGQNPEAAKFPSQVAGQRDLTVSKNRSGALLTASINASVTAIPVTDSSQFKVDQVIGIDSEYMQISSIVGNTLNVYERGFDGSTPASHSNQARVYAPIVSKTFNQISSEIYAIETALGTNLSNVVLPTRQIICATGLTGCGTLAANRTIGLDINALTEKVTPVAGTDFALIWDVAASAHKKAKWPTASGNSVSNLPIVTLSTQSNQLDVSFPTSFNVKIGNSTCQMAGYTATFVPATGTGVGRVYVDTSCAIRLGTSNATFATCQGTNTTVSCPTSITDFPFPSKQIGTVSISTGSFLNDFNLLWDNGGTLTEYSAGAGIAITYTASGPQISATGSGGGAPGGSGTELQSRGGPTTFSPILGSSFDSTAFSGVGQLTLFGNATDSAIPLHFLRKASDTSAAGTGRIQYGLTGTGMAVLKMVDSSATVSAQMEHGGANGVFTVGVSDGNYGIKLNGGDSDGGAFVAIPKVGTAPDVTCNAANHGGFATSRAASNKTVVWFCVMLADNSTYQWEKVTTAP
jgi:hypothetical protein